VTRTTNARIAGFTYLFYAAIGIGLELLMHQARGVGDDAAKLVRIGQHATNVRLAILITLLECFSALVLADNRKICESMGSELQSPDL